MERRGFLTVTGAAAMAGLAAGDPASARRRPPIPGQPTVKPVVARNPLRGKLVADQHYLELTCVQWFVGFQGDDWRGYDAAATVRVSAGVGDEAVRSEHSLGVVSLAGGVRESPFRDLMVLPSWPWTGDKNLSITLTLTLIPRETPLSRAAQQAAKTGSSLLATALTGASLGLFTPLLGVVTPLVAEITNDLLRADSDPVFSEYTANLDVSEPEGDDLFILFYREPALQHTSVVINTELRRPEVAGAMLKSGAWCLFRLRRLNSIERLRPWTLHWSKFLRDMSTRFTGWLGVATDAAAGDREKQAVVKAMDRAEGLPGSLGQAYEGLRSMIQLDQALTAGESALRQTVLANLWQLARQAVNSNKPQLYLGGVETLLGRLGTGQLQPKPSTPALGAPNLPPGVFGDAPPQPSRHDLRVSRAYIEAVEAAEKALGKEITEVLQGDR